MLDNALYLAEKLIDPGETAKFDQLSTPLKLLSLLTVFSRPGCDKSLRLECKTRFRDLIDEPDMLADVPIGFDYHQYVKRLIQMADVTRQCSDYSDDKENEIHEEAPGHHVLSKNMANELLHGFCDASTAPDLAPFADDIFNVIVSNLKSTSDNETKSHCFLVVPILLQTSQQNARRNMWIRLFPLFQQTFESNKTVYEFVDGLYSVSDCLDYMDDGVSPKEMVMILRTIIARIKGHDESGLPEDAEDSFWFSLTYAFTRIFPKYVTHVECEMKRMLRTLSSLIEPSKESLILVAGFTMMNRLLESCPRLLQRHQAFVASYITGFFHDDDEVQAMASRGLQVISKYNAFNITVIDEIRRFASSDDQVHDVALIYSRLSGVYNDAVQDEIAKSFIANLPKWTSEGETITVYNYLSKLFHQRHPSVYSVKMTLKSPILDAVIAILTDSSEVSATYQSNLMKRRLSRELLASLDWKKDTFTDEQLEILENAC